MPRQYEDFEPFRSRPVLGPAAETQYPSDRAVNFAVADGGQEQTQPKEVAGPVGGTNVRGRDSDPSGPPPSGYDVHLQRLDAAG